ncbi:MAG: hypothetical protein DMF82_13830 [Acidobacteria bacterium]|nr:MAG: hypothetical protein DMF82_13830 [Acidobacteriota bacterium]
MGKGISCFFAPEASMITSTGRPLATAPSAKRWPAGSQAPLDSMNWMLSRWGSTTVRDSRLVTLPVAVSWTYSSTEKRSRSDRKARREPSGLSTGPTLSRPP